MNVIKRNGNKEHVSFDKITRRISKLTFNLSEIDAIIIAQEVIKSIHDNITTVELDILSADICASKAQYNPDFNLLGGRILISNLHKSTDTNYKNVLEKLNNVGILSTKFYNFATENIEAIQNMFDYERDYLFDYFAVKTLERSYLLKANGKIVERPQHLFMRTSIQIHGLQEEYNLSIEQKLEKIKQTYDYITNLYFTHATPTLFNSGTNLSQLSSCFLLSSDDNLEDIFKTISDCAKISKTAGGIGISISNIRAKGSLIRGTGGASGGIVPLCKTLESVARYINQGGKRLGSIAVYLETFHADIFEFVELRKNTGDETMRARDLFLALWVNDLFMKRVEEDGIWSLFCPDECPGLVDSYGEQFETLYKNYEEDKKYKKQVKARDLWAHILDCQIETGMPYITFKDTSNRNSMQKQLGTIRNSNLCVAPETMILTDSGYHQIKDLENQAVKVWNGEEFTETVIVKTGENQELIKVVCSNGSELECTPYHKFYINEDGNTKQYEAKDLSNGMKLIDFKLPDNNLENNITISDVITTNRISDTYCFKEEKRGMGIFNGIITGQCNEILLYSDKNNIAVCNLASICLPKFVETDLATNKLFFNFAKLREIAGIVTYNLNNVIDTNFYPTPECKKTNMENRPIGIGVQGLADVYAMFGMPFGSEEAKELNKQIFENIYYGSVQMSINLAKKYGPYSSYNYSPHSQGILQFNYYSNVKLTLDWEPIYRDMELYGMRNSLLTALMPTASTSQIMCNNECFEPYTSNIYLRRTLAGEFTVVNKYLIKDLMKLGIWNKEVYEEILYDNGSVQRVDCIPKNIKEIYRTAFELKVTDILKQAVDRQPFVDHTQSMNLFMDKVSFKVLNSSHFYSWKNGLKTGMYYLRTNPAVDPIKFGLDVNSVHRIRQNRKEKVEKMVRETGTCPRDEKLRELCDSCSS